MPPLSRYGPKLLKHVGDKRHATDEDHEEPPTKRRHSPVVRKADNDEDIDAEPESSDAELRLPKPRPKQSFKLEIPDDLSTDKDGDAELKVPQRRSARNRLEIQGACENTPGEGQANKVKRRDDDKENDSLGVPQSSIKSTDDNPFSFDDMEYSSQRSTKSAGASRKTFGSKSKQRTVNIHSRPSSKPRERMGIRIPRTTHNLEKKSTSKNARQGDDDASDVSVADETESGKTRTLRKTPDPELMKPKVDLQRIQPKETELELPKLTDEQLSAEPAESEIKHRKPTRLQDQLGDWMKDKAPTFSQPNSSAPDEALDNIDDYIGQLPQEEEEGSTCPICKAFVEEKDYWDFWKGKVKSVKNQNAYCREHRVKSAWEEYRCEGYPDINWKALPHRIRQHRMKLYKILHNERPSAHRDRYEPIALTGKAATVPARRKDLPEHVQEEIESYALDDQSTYPGYYGPHGRRIITEHVMKVLKNEIKNCVDPVVQGSGAATFIQAVLVPEMAILLISEDCRVDREEAEEIRDRTYDMGMLLNEEIEDQVEAHESDDDENEYFGK